MTKLNEHQTGLLAQVRTAADAAAGATERIRARHREQERIEIAAAGQSLENALYEAHQAGVPIRRLLEAVGTTAYATVKSKLDAAAARQNPGTGSASTLTLEHYLLFDGRRLTAASVPGNLFTQTPVEGEWTGYMDLIRRNGRWSADLVGENSEVGGPLHKELASRALQNWLEAHNGNV